jgi:hypothetical protein
MLQRSNYKTAPAVGAISLFHAFSALKIHRRHQKDIPQLPKRQNPAKHRLAMAVSTIRRCAA